VTATSLLINAFNISYVVSPITILMLKKTLAVNAMNFLIKTGITNCMLCADLFITQYVLLEMEDLTL